MQDVLALLQGKKPKEDKPHQEQDVKTSYEKSENKGKL